MTNAAIYWNPEAYDTEGKVLLGRHSAGEGFFRGYLRHATTERLALWDVVGGKPISELMPLVERLGPVTKPVDWIARGNLSGLEAVGVLNIPVPTLAEQAWTRHARSDRAYSICGVTHTIATDRALDALSSYAIAPVQAYDALVCTSTAALAALNVQAEEQDAYLRQRFGTVARLTRPQYVHVPLGVNADRFHPTAEARYRWRTRLDIAPSEVMVLYFGRFNFTSKMNPVPMAMALERAAARALATPVWVLCGKAEVNEAQFKEAVHAHCPSMRVIFVDGRDPDVSAIWSAADIFLSLSDNIQETFGLTPVEAMASGLPCVVSDWDGYKDTVRDGVDGFRIRSIMGAPGLAGDLAFGYAQKWSGYEVYVAGVAQFTAVDIPAATDALVQLIDNPDLRLRMANAAHRRVHEVFDWRHIIPQYEALWAELNARRRTWPLAPATDASRANPWRPDPFRMFASFPTMPEALAMMVSPVEGMDWATAEALMAKPLVRMVNGFLPSAEEVRTILAALAERGALTVEQLIADTPASRRPLVERGVIWLAKYGLVGLGPE